MSSATLRLAIERGEIEAEHPLANGPWVINRSALETATALQFAERSRRQRRNPVLEASDKASLIFQRHSQVGIMKRTCDSARNRGSAGDGVLHLPG